MESLTIPQSPGGPRIKPPSLSRSCTCCLCDITLLEIAADEDIVDLRGIVVRVEGMSARMEFGWPHTCRLPLYPLPDPLRVWLSSHIWGEHLCPSETGLTQSPLCRAGVARLHSAVI